MEALRERAVLETYSGRKLNWISREIGVNKATLWRWKRSKWFKRALESCKKERFEEARGFCYEHSHICIKGHIFSCLKPTCYNDHSSFFCPDHYAEVASGGK